MPNKYSQKQLQLMAKETLAAYHLLDYRADAAIMMLCRAFNMHPSEVIRALEKLADAEVE